MCLDTKGRFKPCKIGYKLMELKDGMLFGEFRGQDKPRQQWVWLDEKDFRFVSFDNTIITSDSNSEYPIGWHIYNRLDDAVQQKSHHYSVVKVSVKNPVAVGYEGSARRRVTVAKHIKILKVLSRDDYQDIARKAAS